MRRRPPARRQVWLVATHPWQPDVVLSAGSDGHLLLWDIGSGALLRDFDLLGTQARSIRTLPFE